MLINGRHCLLSTRKIQQFYTSKSVPLLVEYVWMCEKKLDEAVFSARLLAAITVKYLSIQSVCGWVALHVKWAPGFDEEECLV